MSKAQCIYVEKDGVPGFAFMRDGKLLKWDGEWFFRYPFEFSGAVFRVGCTPETARVAQAKYMILYYEMMKSRKGKMNKLQRRLDAECRVSCGKSMKIERQKAEIHRLMLLASQNYTKYMEQLRITGWQKQKMDRQVSAINSIGKKLLSLKGQYRKLWQRCKGRSS